MSTRYVAFLRAVNVGGRTMRMADLREVLEAEGLTQVGTVIQTGNAYFEVGRHTRASLTSRIEKALSDRFGFAVPVMLRTCDELHDTLDASPLRYENDVPVVDKDRLVMFLHQRVDVCGLGSWPLASPKGDVVITGAVTGKGGTDVFVELHRIDGKVPNSATFIEKQLGAAGTGRWLHTTANILRTAREA